MKFAVIGPGALGSLFAALLGRAGHEVWLLDHDPERAALLAARGLLLEEDGRAERIPIRAAAGPAAVAADVVLLCVKSAAVAASLADLTPFLSPDALLLAFQNGVGHLEVLKRLVPGDQRMAAVTAQGATLLAPGRIRYGGRGPTRLGFLDPASPQAQARGLRAAAALTAAGIFATIDDDISGAIWRKLLVNVGINALTALHDCPNGRLATDPHLQAQLAQAVTEAAAIARARGIQAGDNPVDAVLAVCRATATNISSMLQDVRRGRATEIDAINGAIVAEANRLGLAVPMNEKLVRAVKALEWEFH